MRPLECAFVLGLSGFGIGCTADVWTPERDGDLGLEEVVGAAEQPLTGLFRIRTRHSGLCLDVLEASSKDRAPIIQFPCHGGNNQLFQIDDLGNGFHQIRAFHSDKCLDVLEASPSDRAALIQFSCHRGTNQQFALRDVGGYYSIVARHSGKCWDITSASPEARAPLIQYSCHGGYNQQFSLE